MSREGTVPQATKQQHKPRSRTMRPPSVYFGLYLYPTKGLRKIWYILQAMSLIRNHTENLLDYVSSNLPHPNPSRFWKLLSLHSPPWCLVAMFVRYGSSPVTVNGPRLGPIVTGSGCANRRYFLGRGNEVERDLVFSRWIDIIIGYIFKGVSREAEEAKV